MLKVLPVQSKEEQEKYCALCKTPFFPAAMAYAATVDEAFVGICQFTLGDTTAAIHDLVSVPGVSDFEAMFIMGRAALNFIDLCGVHTAVYKGDAPDEGLLKAIGFEKDAEGRLSMDLTDFFLHPCQHHKE